MPVFTRNVLSDISSLCKKGLGVHVSGLVVDYVCDFLAEKPLGTNFNAARFYIGSHGHGDACRVDMMLCFSHDSVFVEADYRDVNHPQAVGVISGTVAGVNDAIIEYLKTGELPATNLPVQLSLFQTD